jgi:hypothetical protein
MNCCVAKAGGAGGGGLSLLGWSVSAKGSISTNGHDGTAAGGVAAGHLAGGGGAGGGILIASSFLDLGGSTLRANGGAGGALADQFASGAGGGGGGRINVYSRSTGNYVAPLTVSVSFGSKSTGGAANGAEEPGIVGSTYVGQDASMLAGVEAAGGGEVAGY